MTENLRLLCVLAHPDDESLLVGALLARYAAEGVETHLVTATRGERGWPGAQDDNPGPTALGKLREDELESAAKVLSLRSVSFLDYIDGDLDQAPVEEATDKIAHHMRLVRPHVVITFSPDGAYGHPDHIAISQFTQGAIVRAASGRFEDPSGLQPWEVLKSYYAIDTEPVKNMYQAIFGELIMPVDGVDRRMVAWPDWAFTTEVATEEYWQTTRDAVACHRTQMLGYDTLLSLPEARLRALWHSRTLFRVFSLVNSGRQVESNIFAGVREHVEGMPHVRMWV